MIEKRRKGDGSREDRKIEKELDDRNFKQGK
jgi:hypothetical protein